MKKTLCVICMVLALFMSMPLSLYAEDDGQSTNVTYGVDPTVTYIDGSTTLSQLVEAGNKATEVSHNTPSGYTFLGWFDEDGNKWNFNTLVYENLTLIARYQKNASPSSKEKLPLTGIERMMSGINNNSVNITKTYAVSAIALLGVAAIIISNKNSDE